MHSLWMQKHEEYRKRKHLTKEQQNVPTRGCNEGENGFANIAALCEQTYI